MRKKKERKPNEKLREARENIPLTQRELAEELNRRRGSKTLKQPHIARWERGRYPRGYVDDLVVFFCLSKKDLGLADEDEKKVGENIEDRDIQQKMDEGIRHFERGNYYSAIRAFEKVKEKNRTYTPADIYIGWSFWGMRPRQIEQAIERFEVVLHRHPTNDIAANALIMLHNELGHYNEALQIAQKLLARNPKLVAAHINHAHVHIARKHYNNALRASEEAIICDPQSAAAHTCKAKALWGLARYHDAIDACQQAIAYEPNFVAAYDTHALCLLKSRCHDQALEIIEEALSRSSDYLAAYNTKALILWEKECYDQALDICNYAKDIDPTYPDIHVTQGNILFTQGHISRALKAYEQARGLNPYLAGAYNGLSLVYLEKGFYNDVFDCCAKARLYDPTDPASYVNQGLAYIYDPPGRYDEALMSFQEALARNPTLSEAHFGKAQALECKGYHKEAELAYKQGLDCLKGG